MRIWEFEDKKETPSDLVREQDFIMRVRRMQRAGSPFLILNFILTAIEPLAKSQAALEAVQNKLKAFSTSANGFYFEMSNGDVFLVWENPGEARLMGRRAIDAALNEYKANTNIFLLTYRLPENYALLRERLNSYVEDVRTNTPPAKIPDKIEDKAGRLTAKTVLQIEGILADIDLRRYGRTQSIYSDNNGELKPIAEEYFISFEDLRREHFPKIEIVQADHYFFAICALLDQKLLGAMTAAYSSIAGRAIRLNLSIASIMGSFFAQFVRAVPKDQRYLLGFELHSGDILQDFPLTLGAIEVLRKENFNIAFDSVTPNMTPYIDFGKFDVSAIKIKVSKDHIPQLFNSTIRKAVERLPIEKIIFTHCDNERALALGREMGVTTYQGWLIDDLAQKQ
ncbi:MAG: hypothetical protein WC464_09170 [Bdellovibrionales bacterium]